MTPIDAETPVNMSVAMATSRAGVMRRVRVSHQATVIGIAPSRRTSANHSSGASAPTSATTYASSAKNPR